MKTPSAVSFTVSIIAALAIGGGVLFYRVHTMKAEAEAAEAAQRAKQERLNKQIARLQQREARDLAEFRQLSPEERTKFIDRKKLADAIAEAVGLEIERILDAEK